MAATRLALALSLATGVVYGQPQPAPEKKPAPQLSERQAERISARDRMIACNRQAREAKLPTAQRQEFIRSCIKDDKAAEDDKAAAGGDRAK